VEGIGRVAEAAGVPLIEDCAHATGAAVGGRRVGSFGRAALFSLEPTKPVAAFGGGVVATDDDELAAVIDRALAARQRREWPAMRKAAMKYLEELMVRSPAYGLAARLLFSARGAERFDALYRQAHDRVRSTGLAFSGYQARLGRRSLAALEGRNRALNRQWQALAEGLPPAFTPQRRDAVGEPAGYNFAALFDGDVSRLRAAAQRRGLDLAIGSEVMDDTARLLGVEGRPGAARLYRQLVQLPLHPGMGPALRQRVMGRLELALRDMA
jgi:dTDP-4-amino-4,6-dideoxygalactose transaminase